MPGLFCEANARYVLCIASNLQCIAIYYVQKGPRAALSLQICYVCMIFFVKTSR